MKKIILIFILLNFLQPISIAFQIPINLLVGQNYFNIFPDSAKDSTNLEDVSRTLQFSSNTHMFVGAEILDPLNAKDFFSRATQIWKTDARIGVTAVFEKSIRTFISIRGNDSPETNSIKLYEMGANINKQCYSIWFGQIRKQMGNQSHYLNKAFDRNYWDKGLIYDFLIRGVGTDIMPGKNQINVFIGSEISASFISGIDIITNPFCGFKAGASALYIARDPQYAGFGVQSGIELEESYKNFFGYQVFSFKSFNQEPSAIKEATVFTEGRLLLHQYEFGAAIYFKRLMLNVKNNDEIRTCIDYTYIFSKEFAIELQTEYFQILGFDEFQIGISPQFSFINVIALTPRVRYIITEFGPDILFVGIESKIIF